MANNCLVTKLKGSVANEFLPTFGYQQIELYSESSVDYDISGISFNPNNMELKLSGNAYFKNANGDNLGETTTETLIPTIHLNGGRVIFEMPNAVWTRSVQNNALLEANNNVLCDFDTSIVKNLVGVTPWKPNYVKFYPTYIHGNISDLFNNKMNHAYIDFAVSPRKISDNFIGSIDDIQFANDDSLIMYSFIIQRCSNVTGNLNGLIDKLAVICARGLTAESRTSSNCVFDFTGTPNVVYNGSIVGSGFSVTITFNSDGTWEEA